MMLFLQGGPQMPQASLFSPLVPSGFGMGGPGTPQPGSQQQQQQATPAGSTVAPGSMFQAATPQPMTPLTPASEGSGITPQLQ